MSGILLKCKGLLVIIFLPLFNTIAAINVSRQLITLVGIKGQISTMQDRP